MEDLSLVEKNFWVIKKWLEALLSVVANSKLLTFITVTVITVSLAFSSQFVSLYLVNKVVNSNSENYANVSEQQEKIHNQYVLDLIDACMASHELDPTNTEKYCLKAKENYFYTAQLDSNLKDSYEQVVSDELFLVMKADISYLINKQSVGDLQRRYPREDFPEISFVFST
ncbi:hypothetical protein PVK63_16465 [Aliivibrio sp. S2TY2]|uniref:hypothetical protein n=1 Tax=unclassified Aliivibrio TaxID=2645654 RepID=UPI00237905B6|nr:MULTISPECIES: hypothetical protein [unclassified Aliivibrio]MDD9176464.1 hypothetical protein [Aliivibrio sp. S3TY1]MDD9193542.1 hypothetical protein [Aliivibrio sp. S2TY2]